MSDTKKLQAKDVNNEVERIKKLPRDERKDGMAALQERIKAEIENYYKEIDALSESEQSSEYARITGCYNVLRWKWKKKLWSYNYDLKKERSEILARENGGNVNASQYIEKINAAHESGLPLPKQAQVNIWWQDNELIIVSTATMFSLPVERIMGMGITNDFSSYWVSGDKTYLTVEYKKDDEIKHIVVWSTQIKNVNRLIEHFYKIRTQTKMDRKEL